MTTALIAIGALAGDGILAYGIGKVLFRIHGGQRSRRELAASAEVRKVRYDGHTAAERQAIWDAIASGARKPTRGDW